MKLKVFGCESIRRELYALAAVSAHEVTVVTVSAEATTEDIQRMIDGEQEADGIALAFGECRSVGLKSTGIPLSAPRVHNCAHLLLGSAERFYRAFGENEDEPCWLNFGGCQKGGSREHLCIVRGGITGEPCRRLPEGTREYTADLSLLSALLNGRPSGDIVEISSGFRIAGDPVEIIVAEPAGEVKKA